MRISLRSKINSGFLLAFLLLLAISAVSYRNISLLAANNEWVINTHAVLENLQSLRVGNEKPRSTPALPSPNGACSVFGTEEEFLLWIATTGVGSAGKNRSTPKPISGHLQIEFTKEIWAKSQPGAMRSFSIRATTNAGFIGALLLLLMLQTPAMAEQSNSLPQLGWCP